MTSMSNDGLPSAPAALLIETLATESASPAASGAQRDVLVLTSEQRRWARGRFRTAGGREVILALPTGTVLQPGQVLWSGPAFHLSVEGAAEPVLSIAPAGHHAALRIAFEVGNRHFPLAIDGGKLLVPDDPAMEHLLHRLGAQWERIHAIFQPVGHGHRHEH